MSNRSCCLCALVICVSLAAASKQITTIAGDGTPGYSETQINNPYGMTMGPDGALYFCEVGNHRVRRLDLKTRRLSDVAGNGQHGYTGDGGPALSASLNEPYEVRFDSAGNMFFVEMQNHVVRRVDARTRIITTLQAPANPDSAAMAVPPPRRNCASRTASLSRAMARCLSAILGTAAFDG